MERVTGEEVKRSPSCQKYVGHMLRNDKFACSHEDGYNYSERVKSLLSNFIEWKIEEMF